MSPATTPTTGTLNSMNRFKIVLDIPNLFLNTLKIFFKKSVISSHCIVGLVTIAIFRKDKKGSRPLNKEWYVD